MNLSLRSALALVAVVCVCGLAPASGDMVDVLGRPVTGIGSTTAAVPDYPAKEGNAYYHAATGDVQYYIPLSTSKGGTFGVTYIGYGKTAGTTSDSGDGSRYSTLSMYMLFDVPLTATGPAKLTVDFDDLDLIGANDPNGFYEAVKFYDADGDAISSKISRITDESAADSMFDWSVNGNDDDQQIVFDDVSALITSPQLFLRLDFYSSSERCATNTPEGLRATLTTTTGGDPVPEPASLALAALGLTLITRRSKRPAAEA
jgi:hypothetical protein